MNEEIKLTDEQARVIADLKAIQEKHQWSDGELAKHLFCGGSTWNKIKSGAYWKDVQDAAPILIKLSLNLKALRRKLAGLGRNLTKDWREMDEFTVVLQEVKIATDQGMASVKRVIVFLAESGGGKTALCAQLAARFDATVVEARSAWKKSYYNCVRDICEACGVPSGTLNTNILEEDLLKHLTNTATVLVIDEAEFFGAEALNLLKLIINRTPTVIVLACIPEAYSRWNRYYKHEAVQVQRRTRLVSEQKVIEPKEACLFLADCGLNGHLEDASRLVAKAANTFGRIDTVREIARELRGRKHPDLDEVKKAIAQVQTRNRVAASTN